jgi:hypothetical protein
LIVGSGFSKALFNEMPTVSELSTCFESVEDLVGEPYREFLHDPELLLSYLGLGQPWNEPEEGLRNQALFVALQRVLAEHIAKCEARAFARPIVGWAVPLLEWLHRGRVPVISLNYDTVIERLIRNCMKQAPREERPREYDLYDLPLSVLQLRVAGTLGGSEVETFQLIKLHGSINWFYSGADGFPGEQVYYRPVDSDSPDADGWGRLKEDEAEVRRLCRDKVPLIIPPVAEKSRFYANRTVRALWASARRALAEAEEVLCVGYSLPDSDLTMKLFLRAFAHPKKVLIVNTAQAESERGAQMLARYEAAFPGVEVDGCTFVCEGSVEKMAEALLGEAQDRGALRGGV